MNKQPINNVDELISSIFTEAKPSQEFRYRARTVEQTTKRGKVVKFTKYDEIPFATWLTEYLKKTEANFYREYTKNGYTFFSGNDPYPLIYLYPEKDGTIGWTW
ncbi:hypothetical protein A9Y76_07060 [Ralstonia insidiosa]|uniref:Uncharacterized protein n=1 Tax=Ralstonia insidiosa TaxID=190721 RepID=A0A191ZVX7_9RALS|nr:hypothetical protein [Ralstonia insidiosa]ANJ72237.1 hypothetical protein A9Y76_07060 [Ralstonia insidiosa]